MYKEKPVWADLKRRLQTIVIPYFSFGLLILIYWQLIERKFRTSDMGFFDSLLGLLVGSYDKLDFNVHMWFLPCFFLTVVLFNIFVNAGGVKLAYIVSAVMSLIYIIVPMPELFWGMNRVFRFIGFYAVGVYVSKKIKTNVLEYRKVSWGLLALLLVGMGFVFSYYKQNVGFMWFATALLGAGGVGMIAMFINENKMLQYLGRISLIVLCIHGPVYRIVVKLISLPLHMDTDVVRKNILLAMLVVTITLGICSIAYEIMIRIAPWMLGKRKRKK